MPNQNWIEVRLLVPHSLQEEASLYLAQVSGHPVIIEAGTLAEGNALIRALCGPHGMTPSRQEDLETYAARLRSYGYRPLEMEHRSVPGREWLDECEARSPILRVGSGWVIRPASKAYAPQPGEHVIALHTGKAFGSGRHSSTILSLQALEHALEGGWLPRPPAKWKALDVGAGTGILALAAAKLGAEVLAIDIDDQALAAAEENVRLNDLQNLVQVQETLLALVKGRFHLILANVAFTDQLQLAEALSQLLLSEGALIVSGFLDEDVEVLQACYVKLDLQRHALFRLGNWTAMILGLCS